MPQPKPQDPSLTKKGTPRKNAPGAGRPVAGRSVNLPRVSQTTHSQLAEIQKALGLKSLAIAIEHAAALAHRKLPIKKDTSPA